MDNEKKKFDDIRKPLEHAGYDIVKMIGKGAFGEVILVKESTRTLTQRTPTSSSQSRSSARRTSRRSPSFRSTSTRKSIS